ncbi:MAG: hypothetical protein ACYDBB_17705 [Armatimonadota bacterium]
MPIDDQGSHAKAPPPTNIPALSFHVPATMKTPADFMVLYQHNQRARQQQQCGESSFRFLDTLHVDYGAVTLSLQTAARGIKPKPGSLDGTFLLTLHGTFYVKEAGVVFVVNGLLIDILGIDPDELTEFRERVQDRNNRWKINMPMVSPPQENIVPRVLRQPSITSAPQVAEKTILLSSERFNFLTQAVSCGSTGQGWSIAQFGAQRVFQMPTGKFLAELTLGARCRNGRYGGYVTAVNDHLDRMG